MSKSIFSLYSHYYDLLYREKDYSEEVKYIASLLVRHGISSGELLEFGSGTGKHGCLLAKLGYRVHGIERSPEMVALADVAPGFSCEVGDMCTSNTGRIYDGVLSLFHVVSYQTANSDVLAVFKNAAMHVKSGGVFIFDFWYSPAVYSQQPVVRIKRIEDSEVHVTRIAEPVIDLNSNRVDVNYTIFVQSMTTDKVNVLKEVHPMRHFSLPEIDLLANSTGFERLAAEEFLTGAHPSSSTWGVCVVLRRY
jgi:SAM-dependent methyltransferase